ncbi:MAG TPA: glycosyltransferase family 39 protein [Rhizomicrobium sp.]|nr:glycosyltransferase family 39 protein [Rhizomicrobium sp.]
MNTKTAKPQSIWEALADPQSVAAILILYCAVHFLVRLAVTPNFTLDESEQMLFSQSLQWGYRFRHPPLITWLTWAALSGTGNSRMAFFLLKYVLMGSGLIAYFAASRVVIRDVRLAALSTFALLTTYVIGYLPHTDLMHTVLLASMLAAFLWAMGRVLTRATHNDYLLLGLVTGFGILSKYIFIVLPIAFAIAIALTPHFRARIKWRPLIGAVLLAIAIVAPYAWWASAHEYSLFGLAVKASRSAGPAIDPLGWLKGVGNLGLALIEFVIPAGLILPLLYWRACKPLAGLGGEDDRAWLRVYEITMLVGAFVMLGAVFFVGAEFFKPRWMHQVLMPLPIYFFLRVKLAGASERSNKIFAGIALGFAILAVIARVVVFQTHGEHCKGCREYWPMQRYADVFRRSGFDRGTILAADYDLAGNLRYVFPDSRILTPGYPVAGFGPPIAGPCLVVWEGDRPLPDETKTYLTDALGAKLSDNALRGDVEATLLTTKNRRDRMNFILLPQGSCK